MGAFARLYNVASFSAAFRAFASAEPERVVEMWNERDSPGSAMSHGDDAPDVLGVLRILEQVVANEGVGSLMVDLEQQLSSGEVDRVRSILDLTGLAQVDRGEALMRRAEYSFLPVLLNVAATVDYRVTRLPDLSEPELVPVYILRLAFDEEIGGAASAVTFQVREDQLRELGEAMDHVRAMRDRFDERTGAVVRPEDLHATE